MECAITKYRSKWNILNISSLNVGGAIIITLFSMEPWFLWPFYNIKVLLIAFFCFLCFPFLKFKTKYLSSLLMCFLLWVYLYFYHATTSLSILITFLIKFLPLSFVINFSDKEKLLYIECLTKVFSYILLISLIFYLLWHIGVAFPKSLLKHPVNSFYGLFENYYMFIVAGNYGLFTRFQSVFTEPGHLGMFSAILLYVNRYDFSKWYTWVIFLSLLLSFSLAAYILFVVGILLFWGMKVKKMLAFLFKIFICAIFVLKISIYIYNEYPNSILSVLIFSRLEFDDTSGIVGNNRNDIYFTRDYENMRSKMGEEFILGIGVDRYAENFFGTANSCYKVFIMQYGILGITILFLFFLSLLCNSPSKLGLGLLLLYVVSFIQRPYALWEIESFVFVSALPLFQYNEKEV